MITKELIDTELGYILAQLGKPVLNAACWQEELGANAPTEAEILAKKAELDAAKYVVSDGYSTGLGYNLGVQDGDQIAFSKLASGLMLLGVPDAYQMEIKDVAGVMHNITFGEFKTIMAGYIPFCYQLWKGA